ncbi:MAG TPA: putative quinol monooxygenase [Terriglobales bacterium]|nr:putative quinol monooxygenase [Terriglobales bacterium]
MANRTARRSGSKKSSTRKAKGARFGKLPKNALTRIVILRPKEGQEVLLEAELRALAGPSRKEEGCLLFDLHRSFEGPSAFLIHEVWESRDSHTRHTKTPHFLRWDARKDSLIVTREAAFWKQIA